MDRQKIQKLITCFCMSALLVFAIYGIREGLFTDRSKMEELVKQSGIWGPLLFVLIQVVQVVIPIIPGGISCAVGVLLFGAWKGLLYNYIGIVIGSCINFCLARRYGISFVQRFVKKETYEKSAAWLEKGSRFERFFALAIFFPCAPDDFLCMLAGLTRMSWKKFGAIILLGKPLSIAAYSMALIYAESFLGGLL